MLPREILERIYKFTNIDTRMKLKKIFGINNRIKLQESRLGLQIPKKINVPKMQMVSHKATINYIQNKKYRLMYTKIHKRGPWFQELFIIQKLDRFGRIKDAWELDLDTNTWVERHVV